MRMLSAVGLGAVAVAVEVGVSIALVNMFAIAAARELRRDRECRDVKISGERTIQQWLQLVKKVKQFFCTKDAYRFKKGLKLQTRCASAQKTISRTSHAIQHTPLVNGVWCAVCGARYTVCAARCTVYGAAR